MSDGADTAALARALQEAGAVRFGEFVLKDGRRSPVYVDLRVLVAAPPVLAAVADALLARAAGIAYDVLAGIPYAGLPLAVAMALRGGRPMVYPRKEVKRYGTQRQIEGVFRPGQRALVVDDVLTTGGAKLEAVAPLRAAGLVVEDILVVIDREESGARALTDAGIRLHRVLTLRELLRHLEAAGTVTAAQARAALDFIGAAS